MAHPAPTSITQSSSLTQIDLQLPAEITQMKGATAQAILFERNPDDDQDLEYYESVYGEIQTLPYSKSLAITFTDDESKRLHGKTIKLGYRVTKVESSLEEDSELVEFQLR